MGLGDLACECQAQTGAVALGRVERQQRVRQDRFVHAAAAVQHIDSPSFRHAPQRQGHLVVCRSGFVRILEQVEQALLELSNIEAAAAIARLPFQPELDLAVQLAQEVLPLHVLPSRSRQFGELGVVADEAFQVARAIFDRRQGGGQPIMLSAAQQLGPRMRKGCDGRQRVVELVADHPDHLLPGLYLLAAQFGRQQAQQDQLVAAAVEAELAAGEMVDVLVVFIAHGEHAITAAGECLLERIGRRRQQCIQVLPLQAASFPHQLAGGEVGVDHAAGRVDQQHRHRRVLHHGVEQQFALHQRKALLPQSVAKAVVAGDQLPEFALPAPGEAEAEIAVAVAVDGTGQRPEQ